MIVGDNGGTTIHKVVSDPRPHVTGNVWMIGLDASVYYCHYHRRMPCFYVPGIEEIDVATRGAAILACVVVMPLIVEIEIVRCPTGLVVRIEGS